MEAKTIQQPKEPKLAIAARVSPQINETLDKMVKHGKAKNKSQLVEQILLWHTTLYEAKTQENE